MTRIRLVLPLALVVLGFCAVPAQATLLVRSNSTEGLVVLDKNGLSDRIQMFATTIGGNAVYRIDNNNPTDIFQFDRRENCFEQDSLTYCRKFGGKINLGLAGGDDNVRVQSSGASFASVNLGTGNDFYRGIPGTDDVFAASGDDDVETRAGNDDVAVGTGQDLVSTGTGDDQVDDSGLQNSSQTDNVLLGPGNDRVNMEGAAKVQVKDETGDDQLTMGSGEDLIVAGVCDEVPSFGGIAEPTGGADAISTRAGDDRICSKESGTAARDLVTCGSGLDYVEADLTDQVASITNREGGTCEEVDRSPVGETPHVRLSSRSLRVFRSGRVRVRLRCPRLVRSLGCRGRLQLRLGRRASSSRSKRVRYRIRAGRRKTVTLKLTRRAVRALQRRGGRTRGILTSVERGRKGRKTTIRNPRLRVR